MTSKEAMPLAPVVTVFGETAAAALGGVMAPSRVGVPEAMPVTESV
jgi:hypothetical protein